MESSLINTIGVDVDAEALNNMIPTTESAKRISTLFGRRITTAWAEKEVKRYRELIKAGYLTPEDLELIERYYVYQRKRENGIHRRVLCTFLNNFSGELDRARAWDEEMRERLKRKIRRPLDPEDNEKPVNDNDWKRISDLAHAEVSRFRQQLGAA